jgi:protocatechuate 3,4-dioxygenase beta subunit
VFRTDTVVPLCYRGSKAPFKGTNYVRLYYEICSRRLHPAGLWSARIGLSSTCARTFSLAAHLHLRLCPGQDKERLATHIVGATVSFPELLLDNPATTRKLRRHERFALAREVEERRVARERLSGGMYSTMVVALMLMSTWPLRLSYLEWRWRPSPRV